MDNFDYWDFHLNEDNPGMASYSGYCMSAYIDTTNPECVSGKSLTSLSEYFYGDACSKGLHLENIGFTGVDNGFISYRKDRITNEEFYKLYTQSVYDVESGDTRLHLYQVTGNTLQYDYPVSINEDGSIKLNGGFYQGFFRSGNDYSVLPSEMESGKEWNLYFKLRKQDYQPQSDKTLNDKYPGNKGIFFYIGTRAENKFIYLYEDYELSGKTYGECEEKDDFFDLIEEDMVLSAQTYDTKSGFSIDSANDGYIMSDSKFLLFDRTPSGITNSNYEGNEVAMISYKTRKSPLNLFMWMNRTPTGYTTSDIDTLESAYTENYDTKELYSDIYNNALAFVINDDGSIGYKYLVKDCSGASEGHYSVLVGNSYPGIISTSQWHEIRVRMKCSGNTMRIMFYVDGKLKYITSELPVLRLHKLNELDEKQEGVAYNISLGGGTQGLAETIFPDYMLNPTKVFPLEENFAGSFIGDLMSFKFYTC